MKNDTLTANLNEMTDFRKAFFRKLEEVIALQKQVKQLSSRLPVEEKTETETNSGAESMTVPDVQPEKDNLTDDRRLFDRIQYEKLF